MTNTHPILLKAMAEREAAGLKIVTRPIDPATGKPGDLFTVYAKDAAQAEVWRARARENGTLVET